MKTNIDQLTEKDWALFRMFMVAAQHLDFMTPFEFQETRNVKDLLLALYTEEALDYMDKAMCEETEAFES